MSNLALAIEMAKKSRMDSKHGAVMFAGSLNNGKVFSTGFNNINTSNIKHCSLRHLTGIHAEIDCLIACKNIFSIRKTPKESKRKMNMLVVRCKGEGLGESKPCELCYNILKRFRIKKIYYSTSNGTIHKIKMNSSIEKNTISKGLIMKMKNDFDCMISVLGLIK